MSLAKHSYPNIRPGITFTEWLKKEKGIEAGLKGKNALPYMEKYYEYCEKNLTTPYWDN